MAQPSDLTPQLCQRYSSLVWYFLDADLHKSALFYAERYFVLDTKNHDARHLYATALLHAGQPHSAHCLVNLPMDARCTGCVEIVAQCCMKLGRHRQAREALETCLRDHEYTATRTSPICATDASRFDHLTTLAYIPYRIGGRPRGDIFPGQGHLVLPGGRRCAEGQSAPERIHELSSGAGSEPPPLGSVRGIMRDRCVATALSGLIFVSRPSRRRAPCREYIPRSTKARSTQTRARGDK